MNDFNRRKGLIYIILGVVILVVTGALIYRAFFGGRVEPAPQAPTGITGRPVTGGLPSGAAPVAAPPSDAPPLPDLPAIAEQKLVRLTDFAVISPSLNKAEDKILYYKKDGGDLLASDFRGGEPQKVSNLTIVGLVEAIWSPNRDRAAVFYLDSNLLKAFLQIGTSSVAILPPDTAGAAWAPDGKSLAYIRRDVESLSLVIADAAAKNLRSVFKTPLPDARISWISSDRISFATAPSGLAEGYIFNYSRSSGAFEKIIGPAFGLQALWSPSASRIMISSTPRGGERLSAAVLDSAGRKPQRLDSATFAEKCVWGNEQELWCAVPRNFSGASPMPDRYLSGEFHSSDRIVRIDLEKNATEEVFGEGNFDIGNLILAKDKKNLFFVNRPDGTLWSLRLQ